MIDFVRNTLVAGLRKKAIVSCSQWAQAYRVMGQPFPGRWSFAHHPWAKEMHDCQSELMIGMKAAQMAYTETALNKVFYTIDSQGSSCLYLLPASTPDASDFSTSRFDPALELSDHLAHLFSDVKNIGHKRAGNANLFIRGARSRSQLKSIPVAMIVFDEIDEMPTENIPLALERMSGQNQRQAFMLSTPTLDNHGIDYYYRTSSQEHFFFRCPHCSKLTELIYPDCFVVTADSLNDPAINDTHLICKECKTKLAHGDKQSFLKEGTWVPSYTDRDVRGFYINQFYSMVRSPKDIAEVYLRGQSDATSEQEFYNSKLGMTHTVEGARVMDKDIEACIGSFLKKSTSANALVTMGVDVGKWLHVSICNWTLGSGLVPDINLLAQAALVFETKVLHFEELDNLMKQYNVTFCVIDANPERRKALEFAQRFWGITKLCFYGNGCNGKQIHVHDENEHTITVDRTSWMDLSLGRFKRRGIALPRDVSTEYKEHIKAPVRVYKKDAMDNPIGRYEKSEKTDDHFAHAQTYAEIALPLAVSLANNQDISNIY